MATNNLSFERELRYIVQWFNEWSELQREDFVPILSDFLVKDTLEGVDTWLAAATCADKPLSLFQCRVRSQKKKQKEIIYFNKLTLLIASIGEIVS